MKTQRINIGELLDGNNDDFFRSTGFATVKITKREKQGKDIVAVSKLCDFEIKAVGNHPLLKEFHKKYPDPIAPQKPHKELISQLTGASITELNIPPSKFADYPEYKWTIVFDTTDEKYLEKVKEKTEKLQMLFIMIAFSEEKKYGLDKIDEFEKKLTKLGMTAVQVNKVAADITELDFFTDEK